MILSVFTFFTLLIHVATPSPISNSNKGIFVNVRIEGARHTIYEGPIFTRGHNVTTTSGGTHHCDGTNHGENRLPGPTATSALSDAAHLAHFTFDGTFDPEFDDFFITQIADSPQTSTQFWGILLNFVFTPVGGCQQEVKTTDRILWAFDAFSKAHFLELEGPALVRKGRPITVTVKDGGNGQPISGASVGGQTTGVDGKAILIFKDIGLQRLKAERADSIRSNALELVVAP